MLVSLSAFARARGRFTNDISLQKLSGLRFLSVSQMLHARPDSFTTGHAEEQKQIHVLGMGNIGTFVSHGLMSIPSPPKVTLMLHHPGQYKQWKDIGRRLILQRNGLSEHKTGYDVEWQEEYTWYRSPEPVGSESQAPPPRAAVAVNDSPIDHLILTVKTIQAVIALKSIKQRLTPNSTVVFLHNGMGVIEEVNKAVFPDPATRPNYIVGIVSHGLYRYKYFNVMHKGIGTTTLGVVYKNPQSRLSSDSSQDDALQNTETSNSSDGGSSTSPKISDTTNDEPLAPSTSYLLRTFARTAVLAPFLTNKTDLQLFQLEKLVINALINPLTVINDCTNGSLLKNDNIRRVQRLLLMEISAVISALPEIQSVPGINVRFAPERLLNLAQKAEEKTAANASSMLQDAAAGRRTEIDYINGYIVRRGEELGITCALNYMLIHLVKGKRKILERNLTEQIPLEMAEPDSMPDIGRE